MIPPNVYQRMRKLSKAEAYVGLSGSKSEKLILIFFMVSLVCIMPRKSMVLQILIFLSSITYHTTGHPDMCLLDKIIFVADYIEPNRKW